MPLKAVFFVIVNFCLTVILVSAFNYEVRSAKYFRLSESSAGQSVLLQKGSPSAVIVGAPKYYSHLYEQNRTGSVFRCPLNKHDCAEYNLGKRAEVATNVPNFLDFKMRNFQLLGQTVDGGQSTSDPLVVCAPRWYSIVTNNYYANGACYLSRNSSVLNGPFQELSPLKDGPPVIQQVTPEYFYAMGQMGLSIQYKDLDSIVFGAPGVLSWKGTLVKMNKLNNQNQIPHPGFLHKDILQQDSYFGYSVTSGKFDGTNVWYAAGAPRGTVLHGQVMVFEFSAGNAMTLKHNIVGPEYGSYFGSSLATAKLGSDTLDLIVGAPTFADDTYDEGKVYVYRFKNNFEMLYTLDGTNQNNRRSCLGRRKMGSRFGTAISNLGSHTNDNKYDSIAISAPQENDGKGVVYIYSSTPAGPECSQRIVANLVETNFQRFGYSLSKGVDIDMNNHNDLAIGSSGGVSVLKSRPVVRLEASLSSPTTSLLRNVTQFPIIFCLNLQSTRIGVTKADVHYTIIFDKRAQNAPLSEDASVSAFCKNITVHLKGDDADFFNNFKISVKYRLKDCTDCPVTTPGDVSEKLLEIPYAYECGMDKICQTNLVVDAQFEKDFIIVGESNTVKLTANLKNDGEPAYLCRLNLTLPSEVTYSKCPGSCSCFNNSMDCAMGNPLKTSKTITYELDLSKISTNIKSLDFLLRARSAGENLNEQTYTVTLNLNTQYKGAIVGSSLPDQILGVSENGTELAESFALLNHGPSPFEDFIVVFKVPVKPMGTGDILLEVMSFSSDESVSCEPNEDLPEPSGSLSLSNALEEAPENRTLFLDCTNMHCKTYVCSGNMLKKSHGVNVQFNIKADFKRLFKHFEKKMKEGRTDILVVSSVGYLILEDSPQFIVGHANAIIHIEVEPAVAWWIWVVSISAALLILGAISFILYKCNFFNRKRVPSAEDEPLEEPLNPNSEGENEFQDFKDSDMYEK